MELFLTINMNFFNRPHEFRPDNRYTSEENVELD